MVRAKFKCEEVKAQPDSLGTTITLTPVTSGSEENEKFFKYTPWGKIEMGTINVEASQYFEVGTEYYIDFTKA